MSTVSRSDAGMLNSRLRSFLFVPGDRPERFNKGATSGADAVILDLEDSVSPERKDYAREAVRDWLAAPAVPTLVRINPLDSEFIGKDLELILSCAPDGLVFPKAEGAKSVMALLHLANGPLPPILPIATETPAAIFELGSYRDVSSHLFGLTWGAEDLPATIGATASRREGGDFTAPYEMARSLTLFAAHAANVAAIETVFPQLDSPDALTAYVQRARRDGFTGMMALHPAQVSIINSAFTPSADELERARAIVEAFEAAPGAGVLRVDGKMVDRPHLVQARRILALSEGTTPCSENY